MGDYLCLNVMNVKVKGLILGKYEVIVIKLLYLKYISLLGRIFC